MLNIEMQIKTSVKYHHWLESVQFSFSVVSDSLWPHRLQHASLPCQSPTPRACSNSCPLSQWCPSDQNGHHQKYIQTINSWEGVEKEEPSCTVDGM